MRIARYSNRIERGRRSYICVYGRAIFCGQIRGAETRSVVFFLRQRGDDRTFDRAADGRGVCRSRRRARGRGVRRRRQRDEHLVPRRRIRRRGLDDESDDGRGVSRRGRGGVRRREAVFARQKGGGAGAVGFGEACRNSRQRRRGGGDERRRVRDGICGRRALGGRACGRQESEAGARRVRLRLSQERAGQRCGCTCGGVFARAVGQGGGRARGGEICRAQGGEPAQREVARQYVQACRRKVGRVVHRARRAQRRASGRRGNIA